MTESGDQNAGRFSQSLTGTDRYGLVQKFDDVSNTGSGSTPGNVTFHSHGLAWRDPGLGSDPPPAAPKTTPPAPNIPDPPGVPVFPKPPDPYKSPADRYPNEKYGGTREPAKSADVPSLVPEFKKVDLSAAFPKPPKTQTPNRGLPFAEQEVARLKKELEEWKMNEKADRLAALQYDAEAAKLEKEQTALEAKQRRLIDDLPKELASEHDPERKRKLIRDINNTSKLNLDAILATAKAKGIARLNASISRLNAARREGVVKQTEVRLFEWTLYRNKLSRTPGN